MRNKATLYLTFCALFAALTAVASQISVPMQPVPINLATFSVYLAGAVLGARGGAISQSVYVLLGAAGLPVFAQFRGGFHVILGPTGGYIIGYVAAAWLVGFLTERLGRGTLRRVLSMIAGMALCYLLGTVWFILLTKTGLWAALTMCVFPFLIGDAVKIAAAAVMAPRLRTAFQKTTQGSI
jgi:biotin transport system substrate-specific component